MIDHFALWNEIPIVVIDLETTGRAPSHDDRAVEIAAVRLEGMKVVRTWQTYLNPDRPIPDEASRVHGLYDEDVALAPRFRDRARDLLAFCEGAAPAAYQDAFDRGFLMAEFWNAGIAHNDVLWSTSWIDILAWTRSIDRFVTNGDGSKVSNRLVDACARRGIEVPGAHGALADAHAAAMLLVSLAPDMPRATTSELIRRQKLLGVAHQKRYEAAKLAGRR